MLLIMISVQMLLNGIKVYLQFLKFPDARTGEALLNGAFEKRGHVCKSVSGHRCESDRAILQIFPETLLPCGKCCRFLRQR